MADIWTDRLSEYFDGELNDVDSEKIEKHLSSCADCAEILGQLRAVALQATRLANSAPENDLWAGVSANLRRTVGGETDVVPISRRNAAPKRRFVFSLPQLLAAGIALMCVPAGGVWLALSGDRESEWPSFAAVSDREAATVLVASFEDPEYEAIVEGLELILDDRRENLDPHTVLVLERSLATIDLAITEAREALSSDPNNSYLSEHLSATMDQKVRLLRRAARIVTAAS